jgi:hypothetical protein
VVADLVHGEAEVGDDLLEGDAWVVLEPLLGAGHGQATAWPPDRNAGILARARRPAAPLDPREERQALPDKAPGQFALCV